jgi:hypothetical protein
MSTTAFIASLFEVEACNFKGQSPYQLIAKHFSENYRSNQLGFFLVEAQCVMKFGFPKKKFPERLTIQIQNPTFIWIAIWIEQSNPTKTCLFGIFLFLNT